MSKSRDRLRGKIIKITKGLFLYRRYSSPNYYIRVRDPRSIKKGTLFAQASRRTSTMHGLLRSNTSTQ